MRFEKGTKVAKRTFRFGRNACAFSKADILEDLILLCGALMTHAPILGDGYGMTDLRAFAWSSLARKDAFLIGSF